MNIKILTKILNEISDKDIIELGEDVDGINMYAIKIHDLICSFKLGDLNIDDFPELKNES